MKYTHLELLFGAISLAFFPASFTFVWFLIEKRTWCLSDFCVTSPLLIRTNLWFFYGFLAAAAVVSFAATRFTSLNRFLSRKTFQKSTISIGELCFSLLMLLMVVTASAWNYMYFHDRRVANWVKSGKPFAGLVLDNLYNASGDVCAIVMGLAMLPVSKNSFLATFLEVPYTSLVRFHIWFSRGLFWLSWFHFGSGFAYLLVLGRNSQQLFDYYLAVDNRKPWGKKEYYIVMGFVAIFALTFVAMTSLDYVRRRWYNTFFYTHFFVFAFMLFAYFHASSLYLLCASCRFSKDKVTSVKFEESGYVTLTIASTKAKRAQPGQFMRCLLPSQKSETEWSSRLVEYLRKMDADGMIGEVEVCLQGPYGKEIDIVKKESTCDVFVFCVGGTGIAACIAAIKRVLLGPRRDVKVFLFWTSRSSGLGSLSLLKSLVDCKVEKGKRPDLKELLEHHVAPLDVSENIKSVGVFVCGPKGLALGALESVSTFQKGHSGFKLEIEVESFYL
ncbi:hypothetical protein BDR26DRAFT_1009462 [Obelidium mucronatum]|nr:hypothetical protein BDR26DRAFT_1009462 [Obelidium mucronatum]